MKLIGRKVKGFKFEDKKYCRLSYMLAMDEHVGREGEIVSYNNHYHAYEVKFNEDYWCYPAAEIESHLVDEWIVGKEYEFTHGSITGWDKRVLLAILPDSCQDRYIVSSDINTKRWTYMSKIRHINQPNKEILEQIEVLEKELENLKSKIK